MKIIRLLLTVSLEMKAVYLRFFLNSEVANTLLHIRSFLIVI